MTTLEKGQVCLDCPVWAWDQQPNLMYGVAEHPLRWDELDEVHEWRGAWIVPVDEQWIDTPSRQAADAWLANRGLTRPDKP